ncbi:hypothetical protein ES707_13080 [subsurface metagenome]
MGGQKVVDKTIRPEDVARALQAGSITIAQAQQMFNGVMPIGDFRGIAAILDLDKLVVQPLVNAELAHILGILDGREEAYDLVTLTTVVGATSPVGTVLTGSLTVPAGEVWFINAVQTYINCTGAANGLVGNWRCSLWTDRAVTPAPAGQAFHPVAGLVAAAGATLTTLDEFGPIATAWVITNKVPLLRLPAGAIITFTLVTTTAEVDVAAASTLQLKGSVGKPLVA